MHDHNQPPLMLAQPTLLCWMGNEYKPMGNGSILWLGN